MRVIALLATYNERRFIEPCLEHLHTHGVDVYLIDNCSTDDTVERAERWLGRGLAGIESFPRGSENVFNWRALLTRKEELARGLEADWFIHLDADERSLPPAGEGNLKAALEKVDDDGCNLVDFSEFTFVPTREEPDHDHANFQQTLRTYYPFAPQHPRRLRAWKAHPHIELASSGGHWARFPDQRVYPLRFPTKHYLFLSVPHAVEKYVERRYDPEEVSAGWHGWRAAVRAEDLRLPPRSAMRIAMTDEELDPSEPRSRHYFDDRAEEPLRRR
jgi:glycosyltransferase involved in cell wall biosynthesis